MVENATWLAENGAGPRVVLFGMAGRFFDDRIMLFKFNPYNAKLCFDSYNIFQSVSHFFYGDSGSFNVKGK